ncbi:hypothetical protein RCG19_11965 [Neobacillus sp. OS1-2]|uniref:hypothetical protein n=1 Tax=Neobacillus sp. OS1-2 TaxID=3070680 RepID=UPI0027DFBEC6|nr:hypothetical protein [Neobacillus sp. OS1-2]WML37964.1 hypothetical protein RCG19_11965 [Neobacillus sp. OS1-2]
MNRTIKIIYFISILLIVTAIIFGIKTKNSFKETKITLNSNEFKNANVSLHEEKPQINYFNNGIKNYTELVNESDLIVTGTIDGQRKEYSAAIKTEFKINNVLENKSLVTNLPEKIYVFEPSYFNFDTYFIQNGYNIMQDNHEYILFLNHLKAPENYNYKSEESITFIPVSTYYGKFELKGSGISKVVLSNQALTYKDIKDQAIVTENQKIVDIYKKIKNKLTNTDLIK